LGSAGFSLITGVLTTRANSSSVTLGLADLGVSVFTLEGKTGAFRPKSLVNSPGSAGGEAGGCEGGGGGIVGVIFDSTGEVPNTLLKSLSDAGASVPFRLNIRVKSLGSDDGPGAFGGASGGVAGTITGGAWKYLVKSPGSADAGGA